MQPDRFPPTDPLPLTRHELQEEFLHALALRREFLDQAQAVIGYDEKGNPFINTKALEIFMIWQAQQLSKRSA